jgi:HD superfamily phosphohydrolase YqeK
MAQELFSVTERHILAALGCHVTLKYNTMPLDRIVFLADHLVEAPANAPYLPAVRDMLDRLDSLDAAIMVLCHALWKEPENPLLTHPWFIDYCRYLDQT